MTCGTYEGEIAHYSGALGSIYHLQEATVPILTYLYVRLICRLFEKRLRSISK